MEPCFAESVIPEALRLAGDGGSIVLVRAANWRMYDSTYGEYSIRYSVEVSDEYLAEEAARLRENNLQVETETIVMRDAAQAVERAAGEFDVDIIGVATHGRSGRDRLVYGSVAWDIVSHARVPVLPKHSVHQEVDAQAAVNTRRILVPLDKSLLAETALPLAEELAEEQGGSLNLITVIPDFAMTNTTPIMGLARGDYVHPDELAEDAMKYLSGVASTLRIEAHYQVIEGKPANRIVQVADAWNITDVVMASHGRTGLSRVFVGSVADSLIHHLHCSVIVVPALVASRQRLPRPMEDLATI
jgi:nucleotide-binding universal stress UspA family protein